MAGASDLALVQRWTVSRDADAFSEIVRRHSSMVYATCLRILRNPAEAEDAAQECFVKLATADLELRTSLSGWLHQVATRNALDRIKIERRRLHRDTAYVETTPATEEPIWAEVSEHVDELIAALPEKYRFAVVSHFLESQSYDAISQTLGIPRSTVAYRVHKGVDLVRRGLSRRGITAATATLAALLASHAAEAAAPDTLTASLGKMAISGLRRGTPARPVSTPGGLPSAVKGIAALFSVLALLGASLWWVHRQDTPVARGLAAAPPHAAQALESAAVNQLKRRAGAAEDPRATTGRVAAAAVAPELETEAPSLAKVSGHVTDNEGNAIPGATVHVRTVRDVLGYGVVKTCETQTGPDGRYTLDVLPGLPILYVHAPGYVMEQSFGRKLEAGRTYAGLDFGLSPSRVRMTGCVVDEAGRGLAGATVHLRACGMVEGVNAGSHTNMVDMAFAKTDAAGAFVLDLSLEGLADVTVECDGYATGYFASVYAPCQDLQLALGRGGSVAGTVTRVDGTPVPDAAVFAVGMAVTSSGRWGYGQSISVPAVWAVADAQGAFRIDRLSEDFTYTVYACESEDCSNARQPEDAILFPAVDCATTHDFAARPDIRVRAGSGPVRVDLVLGAAAVLRGRITDRSTGKPVGGMLVRGSTCGGTTAAQADTTDANGSYALNLSIDRPETAQLALYYVAGGSIYPVDGLPETSTIPLVPGETRTVDLAVDAPVSVPVRVVYRDGSPVEGAGIMTCDPALESSSFGMDSFSDSDGRYTLCGLKPGHEYDIAAGILHKDGYWTLLAESGPVAGAPGETLPEVVLTCDPKGGLAGTVLCPEGYPLWDKLVRFEALNPYSGEACSGEARSNDEGRFTKILALPEGFYPEIRLSLRRGGAPYCAVVRDVTIQRDEITDLGPIAVVPDLQAAEKTAS